MKISSFFTAASALACMVSASAALAAPEPVYTILDGVIAQKQSISGCPTQKTSGLADVTFFKDDVDSSLKTFTISRAADPLNGNPGFSVNGTWVAVPSKSSYTVYLSINNEVQQPDQAIPVVSPETTLTAFLDSLNEVAKFACSIKYPNPNPNVPGEQLGDSVNILQPSILITKSVMTVKNSTGIATLSISLKGKQANTFKLDKLGQPVKKTGSQSSTITLKGNVLLGAGCDPINPGACSVATVTM